MIEMMHYYTSELEERLERLTKKDDVNLVPDDVALIMESAPSSSSGALANFSDYRTAVMMLRVDSATAEFGSSCSLGTLVRGAVVGEIVVEEALNAVIVAVGPNTSESTGSSVVQLLTLTKQVSNKVRLEVKFVDIATSMTSVK